MTEVLNVGHGDPIIFREWWIQQKLLPSIPTDEEFLYEYQENEPTELIDVTHRFHQLFGTDCPTASLVYGNGSTQVINAILYALTKRLNRFLVIAYAPPYYMLMHEFLVHCKFCEPTTDFTRGDIDVEIVIDPNNPSGEHRIQQSKAPYIIFDRAYNWPIYLNNSPSPTSNAPNHITVYTISKCLGMGGLRLGWAFINDIMLAREINRALFVIGICPNSFGQKIATLVFQTFITNPVLIHEYRQTIKQIIHERRAQLAKCTLFTITNEYGPYAWIQSKDGSDIAGQLLAHANLKVYSGTQFGSTPEYARFSLICSTEDFNIALKRLHLI